jgi:hypothetical protein
LQIILEASEGLPAAFTAALAAADVDIVGLGEEDAGAAAAVGFAAA